MGIYIYTLLENPHMSSTNKSFSCSHSHFIISDLAYPELSIFDATLHRVLETTEVWIKFASARHPEHAQSGVHICGHSGRFIITTTHF